jgi:signal transduction histidine kinase
VEEVRLQVANALALGSLLDPESLAGLRRIEDLLSGPGLVDRQTLISALELAGSIYSREAQAQEALLRQIRADARREFMAGLGALLALALLAAMTAWLFPKRLLDPLAHLRARFQGLSAGRFEAMPMEGIDAALVPLFQNYNVMVERLGELEGERIRRAETLEEEVRAAARALLEQHQVLANAQRLAAVGETAAGLAHELRNPLAGILAALENMVREVQDEALTHRLSILHRETERVVSLLNDYLAASRHAPEPPTALELDGLIGDLLSLLRYQAPNEVSLEQSVEEGLRCVLPSGRIRQALLNLVANALQALEGGPGRVEVLARREGDKVRLEVKDDGPGFPPEILRAAGQPFQTGRASGTGLGLATVSRTASDLGGRMEIASPEGGGASVSLILPCPREA